MKQFFFLHYPTSRKTGDGKRITRTNAEDRAELIETLGKECFEENKDFDYLRDPDIPFCFLWVFNSFIEIYNHSGETVTWSDIKAWAEMRNVRLRQTEIDYIIKCIDWANAQIKKMRDEESEESEEEEKENDEGQT